MCFCVITASKSPKVYVRDSGLLHTLLNIADLDTLMGHPSAGASWEGFYVEQICNQLPLGASVSYTARQPVLSWIWWWKQAAKNCV